MKKRLFLVVLSIIILLSFFSCDTANLQGLEGESDLQETSDKISDGHLVSADDMFTRRDQNSSYDENGSILISLNGTSAQSSSNKVVISGSTITITEEADYIISGTLEDGMIIVNAPENAKPRLILDGVDINSSVSAAIYIIESDKVVITLADGSKNKLSNGGSYTAIDENNIDAVIFSKQDLSINGKGSLTVTSPSGHGIASKDDLVITGGSYTINTSAHGLDANDSVRISNASITIDAGKDGIHAENSDDTTLGFVYIESGDLNIASEGDGISAGAYMQINGGAFDIVSGGGSANGEKQISDSFGGFMGGGRPDGSLSGSSSSEDSGESIKGIKSAGEMLILGGSFKIDSADDALHSNSSLKVCGGKFEISTGDDGFHADQTLEISAGTIKINESYEGLEALDIIVSGGDITLAASDDGLNAAGGVDSSGFGGNRGDTFGRGHGGMGRPGGMGGSSSSNGSIVISGGKLYVNASGDGIDANGTLTISGGYITVCGPTQGDTATLDYDVSATITGGTFIGTGAAGMAQTFSDSEQGVFAVSVGNQSAGTEIILKDKDENVIISYAPELPFAVVILSSPDIVKGEMYTITLGSAAGEFAAS